jgi:predicted AlkP superfamily phosphohydrolase/phosphomutase
MHLKNKIVLIGLDCAEPDLVFGKYRSHLPNISKLMENGFYSPMRSCDPPITVPAWSVMFSGKDPGELGLYGFRNRLNYSYDHLSTADTGSIHEKRIWEITSEAGVNSIVIGVPQTYPVRAFNGYMVAGMLAPEIDEQAVYPASLHNEMKQIVPDYRTDIKDFRNEDREVLLKKIYAMTRDHFKLARHLLDTRKWDLFIMVEIGLDRIQHAFWQDMAEDSPYFVAGNKFRDVVFKYYQYLDFEIGLLLKRFDPSTQIIIVSDHGAKTFHGVFHINEWLRREGYLKIKGEPSEQVKLTTDQIDWKRTKVWAEGGYYSRIFFNVNDREPSGILDVADIKTLKSDLAQKLKTIRVGRKTLKNIVLDPAEIYKKLKGIPPDLMIYLDEFNLRASAAVGCRDLFSTKNDTGPDGANHNYDGIFIINRPLKNQKIDIYSVTPTIMELMGLNSDPKMTGKSVL